MPHGEEGGCVFSSNVRVVGQPGAGETQERQEKYQPHNAVTTNH